MFDIFDWVKIGGSVLLGLLIASAVAYPLGHLQGDAAGYARAQVEARERALDLIKKRSDDNEEISNLDMADLCRELDGVWVPDAGRCD